MWRQSFSKGNRDPDHGLSDDEDSEEVTYDNSCGEKLQLLLRNHHHNNKHEALEDLDVVDIAINEFHTEQPPSHPTCPIINQMTDNVEESISEEKEAVAVSNASCTFEVTKCQVNHHQSFETEKNTWSAISEEAQELVLLHEKATSSSALACNEDFKGARRNKKGKGKHKFSIHFQSQNGDLSCPIMKDEKALSYAHQDLQLNNGNRSITELLDILKTEQKGATLATDHIVPEGAPRHDVLLLLGNLQEMAGELEKPSRMKTKGEMSRKKFSVSLGERSYDNKSALQENEISSEDEEINENQSNLGNEETKGQMLVDLFQEAFPTDTVGCETSPFRKAGNEYDLQQMDGEPKKPSRMLSRSKKTKGEMGRKKFSFSLGERSYDNESALQENEISNEYEDISENQLNLGNGEIKGQMMVDLFHEAFPTETVGYETSPYKQAGIGYFGRLQHLMQMEKDSHVEFLKQTSAGVKHDDSSCTEVRILSRLLDAKLVVCRCLLDRHAGVQKRLKDVNDLDNCGDLVEKTIIFQSKICNDVELDVGNTIRIHPPWREVQISEDEDVMLCTYFSQIS